MDLTLAQKFFLVFTLILTIIVSSIGLGNFNKTKAMETASDVAFNTISQNLAANEFSKFDKQFVSGADVVGAINTKASSELSITVITKANSSGRTYTSPNYSNTNKLDIDYIEHTASFYSTIGRATNDSVISITFVQK